MQSYISKEKQKIEFVLHSSLYQTNFSPLSNQSGQKNHSSFLCQVASPVFHKLLIVINNYHFLVPCSPGFSEFIFSGAATGTNLQNLLNYSRDKLVEEEVIRSEIQNKCLKKRMETNKHKESHLNPPWGFRVGWECMHRRGKHFDRQICTKI